MSETIKLDIGCGDRPLPGFIPVDQRNGLAAYPLGCTDGTVDEIHASHILEHFGHGQVAAVLRDWVAKLKPGGLLRVAVPDFAIIARAYLEGQNLPIQGYVMGGQVNQWDHHGTIFDADVLTEALADAGLIGISRWVSDQQDCAALPISLNLQGNKPPENWPSVAAVLSCPRLGWNDFWGCALESLAKCGIGLTKYTGAFWEQGVDRAIKEALKKDPEWILTLDYDTVFTASDIRNLQLAAMRNPHADAIAALQSHRTNPTPLMTMAGEDGANLQTVPIEAFDGRHSTGTLPGAGPRILGLPCCAHPPSVTCRDRGSMASQTKRANGRTIALTRTSLSGARGKPPGTACMSPAGCRLGTSR